MASCQGNYRDILNESYAPFDEPRLLHSPSVTQRSLQSESDQVDCCLEEEVKIRRSRSFVTAKGVTVIRLEGRLVRL